MAKSGLNFFPLDCQLDEKFELIEAEFGMEGFAVIIKLLQRIYAIEGYYCEWSEEVSLLFSKQIYMEKDRVQRIIEAAIRRGIFSREIFEKHNVLTSNGIQKRFVYGSSRKQKVELKEDFLLLENDDLRKNVYIIAKNVNKNQKNVDISKQTKRDETRRDETKRNETKQDENRDSSGGGVFSIFERCGFQITSHAVDELKALTEEYSEAWVIEAIKRSSDRGKKSLGYMKGILSRWQIAGAIDDSQKSDKECGPTEAQKQATAEKKMKAEQEAEAMIEREREQMMATKPDPQSINYNFLNKI